MTRLKYKALVILAALTLFTGVMSPCFGAWYNFANQKGVPEIAELRIGSVDLETLPDILKLTVDDLENGTLTIRGLAEISEGTIGAVMISFDRGETWEKVEFDGSGNFIYTFRPDYNREYGFSIKAIATTGKASDFEDSSFDLVVDQTRYEDKIKLAFNEMLQNYMNKNRSGFMQYISDDFVGDLAALEDAIDDDFSFLNNIRITTSIIRISPFKNSFDLDFTYRRTVQSATTGQSTTDNAASSMTFKKTDEGVKLVSMAAPLIFGVTNTAEVATEIQEDSVGQDVLSITSTGETSTAPQVETVAEIEEIADNPSDIIEGTASIDCTYDFTNNPFTPVCPGFYLDTMTQQNESVDALMHGSDKLTTDFGFWTMDPGPVTPEFSTGLGVGVVDTGKTSFADVTEAPSTGYFESAPVDDGIMALPGRVYALYNGEFYALIRPNNMSYSESYPNGNYSGSFSYKIQLNGTTSMR